MYKVHELFLLPNVRGVPQIQELRYDRIKYITVSICLL